MTADQASQRIAKVVDSVTTEGTSTASGGVGHHTVSVGMASVPADGSTLASLERICETGLRRARETGNSIVVSGERPAQKASDMVDVVLVDDDDAVGDVIEYALNQRHYGFLRFSDGAEAATALGQGDVKAKVVLLDVGLTSLDGFGVLEVLRSNGILNHTRVIMLTARSSEKDVLRALHLGASEHISKPFTLPVLMATLEQTPMATVA
jgi:CheY-like chemotaxis protein